MNTRLGMRNFSMLIAWLAIMAYFAVLSPQFLGARNLSLLTIELSVTAVLALGMLLVMLPGEIDLSVGSGVALFGGIAAVLVFNQDWPAAPAMGAATVLALLTYWAMGSLIVKEKIPSFIITLGGLLVFRGLQWLVIQNQTIPVAVGGSNNLYTALTSLYLPPWLGYLLAAGVIGLLTMMKVNSHRRRKRRGVATESGELVFLKLFVTGQLIVLLVMITNRYQGLPLPVVILAATAFIVHVLTQHTRFGRYLYAIGGNREAAVVSGIRVDRIVIMAFAAMGLITALTGFLQAAYTGASTTTIGTLMELDAIAACVIGGTSLRGGRGNVIGVLFGALIMATLLNGMTLIAVSPEMKYIARGLVLALAVWMDIRLARRSAA